MKGYLGTVNQNTALLLGVVMLVLYSVSTSHAVDGCRMDDLDGCIGWLHGNCMGIKNSGVKKGALVTVVELGDGNALVQAMIVKKAHHGKECNALRDEIRDTNLAGDTSFYVVSSKKRIELGVGVINSSENDAVVKNLLHGRKKSLQEKFKYCTTAEGIRFTVWSGKAYDSKLLWSGYYYLGYDTEENCPPFK